jgi:hypothetical protein
VSERDRSNGVSVASLFLLQHLLAAQASHGLLQKRKRSALLLLRLLAVGKEAAVFVVRFKRVGRFVIATYLVVESR